MSTDKIGPSGSVGPKDKPRDSSTTKTACDALTIEFQYYAGAIRDLAPAMSDPVDRARAMLWINKLFGAEYHVEVLRDKRNRYLAALTVNMINDELIGIFAEDPPNGTLENLTKMRILNAPAAEWERDTTWSDYVSTLPENFKETVWLHMKNKLRPPPREFNRADGYCKHGSFDMGQQLDNEFTFLLCQIRPYAALMPCPDAKTKVAAWMQTLCRLGSNVCDRMKALRNDYAYVLYGYVKNLRIAGPFQDYPPWDNLPSLPKAAKIAAKRHPLMSPYSEEASSFLEIQPTPEEGAFCYIAVTGDFANPDAPLPP